MTAAVGESTTRQVWVRALPTTNDSSAATGTIRHLRITGPDASSFGVAGGDTCSGFSDCTVALTFLPESEGTKSATLEFDPPSPDGSGNPPECTEQPERLDRDPNGVADTEGASASDDVLRHGNDPPRGGRNDHRLGRVREPTQIQQSCPETPRGLDAAARTQHLRAGFAVHDVEDPGAVLRDRGADSQLWSTRHPPTVWPGGAGMAGGCRRRTEGLSVRRRRCRSAYPVGGTPHVGPSTGRPHQREAGRPLRCQGRVGGSRWNRRCR